MSSPAVSTSSTRRLPVFPNYTQMPQPLPAGGWYVARGATVVGLLAVVAMLLVSPAEGLALLWGVMVPSLPLVWLLAPGIWRNVCPLAAANQTPRVLGFTRALAPPAWFKRYQYGLGVGMFVVLVTTRKVLFNSSGLASALLLLSVLTAAFVGGVAFKGKSGWCSSICPLLPIQRLYGQTPLVTVPNAHCEPCVGCTKNCYDFNPGVAQFADLYDKDDEYAGFRRTFAGLFPGLVVGFFTIPDASVIGGPAVYGRMGVSLLVSLGAYNALRALLHRHTVVLTAAFGAAGITLFYAYGLPLFSDALHLLFGASLAPGVIWSGRVLVSVMAAIWLVRTGRREREFLAEEAVGQGTIAGGASVLARVAGGDGPQVTFEPGSASTIATAGEILLRVAERAGVALEPGCRMGVCGADPVAVLHGADNLAEMDDDERSTLDRLGLLGGARMACVARVTGPVTVSTDTSRAPARDAPSPAPTEYDAEVRRVVVLGNGIAGVTAADHARRIHPETEIHLVSREVHHLYNRMGISRLVYGSSAMHGLHLNPDGWYDDHNITLWLNTQATAIDRDARTVSLATGELLAYDRLILATGARAFVPPIQGWGCPGTWVMRDAEDAMGIRSFAQQHGVTRAVVAGGGLLGLEAAYALFKLGLDTTVVERGDGLLQRQLDAASSALLQAYLEGLGIHVVANEEVVAAHGGERLERVVLTSDAEFRTDILVVAAGVRPNTDLAMAAGLEVENGVLIDDHCRTSDPNILAAGDVCQHAGRTHGLWPAAVDQARVAGRNAVLPPQATESYTGTVAVTMLKVAGVDLVSMGRIVVEDGDEVIVHEDPTAQTYAKLVVTADGLLVGAILLGHPEAGPLVTSAVKQRRDVGDCMSRLRELDFGCLDPHEAFVSA